MGAANRNPTVHWTTAVTSDCVDYGHSAVAAGTLDVRRIYAYWSVTGLARPSLTTSILSRVVWSTLLPSKPGSQAVGVDWACGTENYESASLRADRLGVRANADRLPTRDPGCRMRGWA